MLTENERWILSLYRSSEISGSLFFGRLARSMKPGSLQRDMTKHFADESMHAWYWTDTLEQLGSSPLKLREAYQDQYLEAAGMPVNVMEVLAITQVFEQRVIAQYAAHTKVAGLDPAIKHTLEKIMEDERWHIHWIRRELMTMESRFGEMVVNETLERFRAADREVYKQTMAEHEERFQQILQARVEVRI